MPREDERELVNEKRFVSIKNRVIGGFKKMHKTQSGEGKGHIDLQKNVKDNSNGKVGSMYREGEKYETLPRDR